MKIIYRKINIKVYGLRIWKRKEGEDLLFFFNNCNNIIINDYIMFQSHLIYS